MTTLSLIRFGISLGKNRNVDTIAKIEFSNFVCETGLFIIVVMAIAGLMSSCNEEEIVRFDKQTEYTFSIVSEDHKTFDAAIEWGVNDLNQIEYVHAGNFASSVKLAKNDALTVRVSTHGLKMYVRNNRTGIEEEYVLVVNAKTIVK